MSATPKDLDDNAEGQRYASPTAVGVAALIVLSLVLAAFIPASLASLIRFGFRQATPPHVAAVAGLAGMLALCIHLRRRRAQTRPAHASSPLLAPREGLAARIDTVPWPLSVALIAAAAGVGWYSLGRAAAVPRIFSDEIIYANAARSLAESGRLSGHGYGLVTPALDAIAYLSTGNDVDAYRLIQAINVAVMVCAAFPAYLLARRALAHRSSLTVAALTVLVPWLVYARFVMTEAAFYPIFLLFTLALARALERPSVSRQAVLALALALAFASRTQAVALAGAVVSAVLLYGIARSEVRATARAFTPTWILYGLTGAFVIVLAALGAVHPLGAYSVLLDDTWRHPHGLLLWVAANVTALSLALGVLVVIAAPLGAAALLAHRATAPEQAFAAAAVSSMLWLLLTVAVLSVSPYGGGTPHERNLFFVAPLLFICALGWGERGFPRPLLLTAATAAGAVALAILMPDGVITTHAIDALSFKLWAALPRGGIPVATLIVAAVAVGAAIVVRLRVAWPLAASVVLGAIGVAAASDYRFDLPRSLIPSYAWVDRTVPADARAAILWIGGDEGRCPAGAPKAMLERLAIYTEYFNSRIGPVGHLGADNPDRALATDAFAIGPGGIVTLAGAPLRPGYVVTDARVGIVGSRLALLRARDVGVVGAPEGSALALWRVAPPLRLSNPAGALVPGAACAPFPD